MSSSISHFRWLFAAFAIFVTVEITVGALWPRPDAVRNNFLGWGYATSDPLQRAYVAEKVQQFDDTRPDIIQVGDSSGLHAVQPPIVESYLGGRSYLNLSIATNVGFDGYRAIAQRMMERSGSVKVLVLYFAAGGGQPRTQLVSGRDLMADDVWRELVSPFHRLFHVPTLGVRREVTDRIFYLNGLFNPLDRPASNHPIFEMIRASFAVSGGWARETDIPEDHINGLLQMQRRANPDYDKHGFGDEVIMQHIRDRLGLVGVDWKLDWRTLRWRTLIDIVLSQYLELARAHGARLMVAVNPAPEAFRTPTYRIAFDTEAVSAELRRFTAKHPEVLLLDGDYWPDHKFSVWSHVGTPYSVESSHRVGRFLEPVMRDMPPPASREKRFVAPERVVLDMAGSPSLYGFTDVQTEPAGAAAKAPPRKFRTIRQGRFEGLMHARARPGQPLELRLSVLQGAPPEVLAKVAVGVYGVNAERLADVEQEGNHVLRFLLPASEVARHEGWMEISLSTRAAIGWQGNEVHPDATGPQLRIERIEIAPRE